MNEKFIEEFLLDRDDVRNIIDSLYLYKCFLRTLRQSFKSKKAIHIFNMKEDDIQNLMEYLGERMYSDETENL